MADVKVLIIEKDGTQFFGAEEHLLIADDIPFYPGSSGMLSNRVKDAIIEAFNSGGGSSEDHHSGWYKIITGQTVEVEERKQMRIKGTLENSGTIVNNGILVID